MSFKTGDYVVYKKKGIYIIDNIRKEKICGALINYYILKSVYDQNATVYVPVDCENLVNQMESVLSVVEIEKIIEKSKGLSVQWASDHLQRQSDFNEILGSNDLSMVIALMLMLQKRRDEASLLKAKVSAVDERALTNAKRVLSEAFAFSLGLG